MKISILIMVSLLLSSNVYAKKKKKKNTYIKGSVQRYYAEDGYRQNAYGVTLGVNFKPVQNTPSDKISSKKSKESDDSDQ
jgi:hypothetical protein